MKPGNLVQISVGWDLEFCLEPITEETPHPKLSYERIGEDELLLVLQVATIPRLNRHGEPDTMAQVLTPKGSVGWLFADQLEVRS